MSIGFAWNGGELVLTLVLANDDDATKLLGIVKQIDMSLKTLATTPNRKIISALKGYSASPVATNSPIVLTPPIPRVGPSVTVKQLEEREPPKKVGGELRRSAELLGRKVQEAGEKVK